MRKKSFNDLQLQMTRIIYDKDWNLRPEAARFSDRVLDAMIRYCMNISRHFGCGFGKMSVKEHDIKVTRDVYMGL